MNLLKIEYDGKILRTDEEILTFDEALQKALQRTFPNMDIEFYLTKENPKLFRARIHRDDDTLLFSYDVHTGQNLYFAGPREFPDNPELKTVRCSGKICDIAVRHQTTFVNLYEDVQRMFTQMDMSRGIAELNEFGEREV